MCVIFPSSGRNLPHDKDHVRFSRNCKLAHRVTANASLLAPICQSAAGVLNIVSRDFLHYWVSPIPIIIIMGNVLIYILFSKSGLAGQHN